MLLQRNGANGRLPTLSCWPLPARLLATCVIVMLAIGMAVAAGQIVIHDIIPTFAGGGHAMTMETGPPPESVPGRGDLFGDIAQIAPPATKPFHESDEFIFALKFTHIHVFGMSGIFIVMGSLAVFLDKPTALKSWLVVLPFVGILLDLAGVWLKLFVHPAFFWLHVPGGLMFAGVFTVESIMMLAELWFAPARNPM